MNIKGSEELMERIGYTFNDEYILKVALTHSSFSNEHRSLNIEYNERMEFLGDAVLELVISEYLYGLKPAIQEGQMTRQRASIVCEATLAFCAEEIELGKYLLLGKGEELTGGRKRASVVSDALEALIGAMYLDGGFESAKKFIYRFILTDLEHKQLFTDSKTILQEMVQSSEEKLELCYKILKEEGPDHNKLYMVAACINNDEVGRGTGKTKKAAEQDAAYRALLELRKRG